MQVPVPEFAGSAASSSTGTPKPSASVSFDPSPATTKFVFLDTEPETFAPWFAAEHQPCGEVPAVPVKTKVSPASV